MTYTNLFLERRGRTALLRLDHPPANAISRALLFELDQVLDLLGADAETRTLVITGTGDKVFSAGADFREAAGEDVADFVRRGAALFDRIEHFHKPVIAALNGDAFGGGLELALACHLRFMSDAAQLAFTEVGIGLMPAWGATHRLARLAGRARALEWLLSGERIDAQDALIAGVVNRIYRAPELLPSTLAFAAQLADGAPLAMAAILDAVVRGAELPPEEAQRVEAEHALALGESEDAVIGVTALAEGKPPQFTGR